MCKTNRNYKVSMCANESTVSLSTSYLKIIKTAEQFVRTDFKMLPFQAAHKNTSLNISL